MRGKTKKRLLSALLAAALVSGLWVPAPASAAEPGVTGSVTAAVRIDYAQRLDELQRRNLQLELRRGNQTLGTVPLAQEGSYTLGGYEAQVALKNTDGGELLGGLWPGFLEVTVRDLPQGEYTLSFTGTGYKPYSQTLSMTDHAKHLVVGTGDATFTLGDVNGDGKVDAKDRTALSAALGSTRREDLLPYDLSGDGVINIVDLAYVNRLISASGGSVLRDTTLLAPPADLTAMANELAGAGTVVTAGDLQDLFADNGAGVTLTSQAGEDIVLPLPLTQAVETQELQIVSPAGGGALVAGEALVEDVNGDLTRLPFDNTAPAGVHATSRTPGSSVITLNLGRRVPVKKVTITVTKTEGGNFAAVESIQFLKDIVPEVPVAPNSVVKGLAAEPGSECVTLKWYDLPNVSGYKVLYWPQQKAKEVKELHTDVTNAKVTGLENLETYVFTVTPTDGNWEGKASDPVTATPVPAKVPDRVDMVSVTALDAALSVSWKEGKSATWYEVWYQEKGTDTWLQAGGRLTKAAIVIENLTNDVTYSVYVVAGNDVGKGPRSALYEGTPKAVKYERPEGIPTQGILDPSLISDIRLADAGNYAGSFDPRYMIDDDYRTAWTAQNWWRNEHVVVTFTRPVDLNSAIWVPRLDSTYPTNLRAYSVRVWYEGENLSSSGHLLVPNPQAGGVDNGGTGRDVDTWPALRGNAAVTNFAILPFGPVKNVVKVSLAVEQRGYTTVSLSELMFQEYDPAHSLPGEIAALFADGLYTTLADGVTQERLDALRARLESDEKDYYLNLNTLTDELALAQELLTKGTTSGVLLEGLDSRSGGPDSAKYSQGGSDLQPLGVTAGAGRELTVYAQGIPEGEKLTLYATQFNAEASQWRAELGQVENGRNILTVPKIGSRAGNNGGSLYAVYSGVGGEEIKLHIRRGVDIPTLELSHWYSMEEAARRETIGAYVDELEAYLSGMTIGSPTSDYRNVTEISTPVVLLSLPALSVKAALGAGSREEKIQTLYNDILAWEDIMAICKRTQGIDNVYENNDMLTRQNIRCMTMFAGAFMYAAGNHIGIGYGSCAGMAVGRPISLLPEGASANSLFGWGIAHEIGHNMDKLGKAETTNNIYSIMVQTWDGKENTLPSRLEKSGKYGGIFTKVAQGYPGASNDVFVQLGMYWQLHLAYDGGDKPLDFYNKFFKAWKAGTYTAGAQSYDDRLALTAAGVVKRDLTEFFTRWGLSLSDSAKKTLSGYEKESRAIWYLNDQSRRDRLAGTGGAIGAVKAAAVKVQGKDNEILLTIDPSGIKGTVQGYEIRRNGQSVAFVPADGNREVTYTDVIGSGNHRTYAYEVAAYDTLGSRVGAVAQAGELRVAYDRTLDPSDYDITTKNGAVVITLKKETPITGLKIENLTLGGGDYTVSITDGEGKTTTALTGVFDREHNLAVDDKESFVSYFRFPGAPETDSRIWTYDAKTVTITGVPAAVRNENVKLITYPGDDVAFLEGGTMGLLREDYHYTSLDENGNEVRETIPAGTLVILGTYRGDPVYNTLSVTGRFTGTTLNEDGEITEEPVVERPVAGYALLFAQIPETGEICDISNGVFLFVPDVQQEAQLQGEASHCEVTNLLPAQIRVELYRTDDPNDASSKRLTAQTLWIHSPGGAQEDLPAVVLEGGQG
ncbi:MAG: hypothetical protein HFF06_10510 [Oscillospiraceae bacterium]|jgi:hypothetical protein|nr:hypothetical protein [Oscillospiraceae bacterium]